MQTNSTKVWIVKTTLCFSFVCLHVSLLCLLRKIVAKTTNSSSTHTRNINQCGLFFRSIKCQNLANGPPSNAFKLHINRNQTDESKKSTHSLFVISLSLLWDISKHCSNKIMAFGITVIDVIIKHRTAPIAVKINSKQYCRVATKQNQSTCDTQHHGFH